MIKSKHYKQIKIFQQDYIGVNIYLYMYLAVTRQIFWLKMFEILQAIYL